MFFRPPHPQPTFKGVSQYAISTSNIFSNGFLKCLQMLTNIKWSGEMKSPLLFFAIEHFQLKQFILDGMNTLGFHNANFSHFFKRLPKIFTKLRCCVEKKNSLLILAI